jgi:hypothetical protein
MSAATDLHVIIGERRVSHLCPSLAEDSRIRPSVATPGAVSEALQRFYYPGTIVVDTGKARRNCAHALC